MYNLKPPTTYSRHVVYLNDLTNPYHLKFSRSYPRVYQAFQPNAPDGKSINYAIKRLFHGSNQLVRFPLIKCSKQGNDFGLGFYTTSDEEQARRFAKKIAERHGGQDRVSSYLFDDSILRDYKVLNFPMSNLRWLDYITINRMQGKPQHVADLKTFIDFNNLGELLHQQPDYVSGPIADGQLFNILEQYMKGEIWPSDALKALHSEKYTDQIVFKNQDLLNKLKFDEKNSH